MAPSILIAGAGLSGLSAAWHCQRHGLDFHVIEARDRLGGRALSQQCAQGAIDLGPSWVWHGQPYVHALLQHFSIPSYDQYCEGTLLHQTPDGQIHHNTQLKPMQYAQRIQGGIGTLVSAMAADLPSSKVLLNAQLYSINKEDRGAEAVVSVDGENQSIHADKIALAFPPRLVAECQYQPILAAELNYYLQKTPTWMAAQAKFFALYNHPFWRSSGFSGDAFSATGVLAEVHDASSPHILEQNAKERDACYALFGFVRLDARERARMGSTTLQELALQQLASFFGEQALKPMQTVLQDWSAEPLTAAASDRQALQHHPNYSAAPSAGESWADCLDFISAETSSQSGGLIEGALQRGAEFAQKCFEQSPKT